VSPETLGVIESYWSVRLGADLASLAPDEVHVLEHSSAFAGYNGVYAWRRGDTMVILAPASLVQRVRSACADTPIDRAFDAEFVSSAVGSGVERVVGPAWLGYAGLEEARPVDAAGVRLLEPADRSSVRGLAAAVGEEAWEHGGIDVDSHPIFGAHSNGSLVAAASYRSAGERVLHVGVVTHPAHRMRGLGRAVASAATSHGLATGAVMQWQTLLENAPSLRVGEALGYQTYCQTIAVRLLPPVG
jgi:GNAT superfamily N-acetyltransferase